MALDQHLHYVGIDPGFSGALALMSAEGTSVEVWDMPLLPYSKDRQRELDIGGLVEIYRKFILLPDTGIGIEWPSTRPGEGAERSERFGRQKGILEALTYCSGLAYTHVPPNLWKGRLGLPGKTDPDAVHLSAEMFIGYYPEYGHLIVGPRGGLKDGRIDALLVAHFLRTGTYRGAQTVVERHGQGSPQAMALMLRGGRGKRKSRGGIPF